MKTSFHFGNLNKQKYKSYYYHGLKLICKEPFNPPPYIIFPLHTPINPPNYFYECDGLPDTATPPLTKMNLRNFNLSSSNSLLHLVGTRIRPGYRPLAKYFWQFGYKDYVEFSVSFPRVQYIGTSSCTFQLEISLSTYGDPFYRSLVAYEYTYGEVIITNSYTDVVINTKKYYIGPFITQINGKIAKSPLTGKYNYFINNILVKSDVTSAPSAILLTISATNDIGAFVDLDYLRAWVNIPQVP